MIELLFYNNLCWTNLSENKIDTFLHIIIFGHYFFKIVQIILETG
jgi:hypothetical protein